MPRRSSNYYPHYIGLPVPASSKTFALLVEGKDDKGDVSLQIMSGLLKRGARILSQNGKMDEKTGDFTLCLVCDLREMNQSSDDLVIQIRRVKNVRHAQGLRLRNNWFVGLLFPVVMMETERSVAISSGLTFQIQEKLTTPQEKSSFVGAAEDYGKLIVNKIKQKFDERKDAKTLPQPSIEVIQDNVRSYMMAAGWGRINWQTEENIERVLIHDPPTVSSGGSGEGNLFLQGMIAGMMEIFRSKKFSIIEDHYDMQSRLLTLAYVEQSLVKPVEEQSREQLVSVEQKVKVLEELEKIIDAVEGKPGQEQAEPAKQEVAPVPVAATADSGMRVQVALKRKTRGNSEAKKPAEQKSEPKIEKPEPIKDEKPAPTEKAPEKAPEKPAETKEEDSAAADSVLILASEKERQQREMEKEALKNPPKEPQPDKPPSKDEKAEKDAKPAPKKNFKSFAKNPPGYVDEFTLSDELTEETIWL